eukprot:IDg14127t1
MPACPLLSSCLNAPLSMYVTVCWPARARVSACACAACARGRRAVPTNLCAGDCSAQRRAGGRASRQYERVLHGETAVATHSGNPAGFCTENSSSSRNGSRLRSLAEPILRRTRAPTPSLCGVATNILVTGLAALLVLLHVVHAGTERMYAMRVVSAREKWMLLTSNDGYIMRMISGHRMGRCWIFGVDACSHSYHTSCSAAVPSGAISKQLIRKTYFR